MSKTKTEEVERKIAKTLIEERDVLISGAEIVDILQELTGENDVDRITEELVKQLPLHLVYDGFYSEDTLYLFLPKAVVGDRDTSDIATAVRILLGAVYGKDIEGLNYNVVKTIVAYMLYEKYAGWNEYGNPLAWYSARLAFAYELYEEEVDRISRQTYVGPVYYRIGDIWIVAKWSYCNYSRHGYDVGIQKCVYYDYSSPKDE